MRMRYGKEATKNEFMNKYLELMHTIDEMHGENKKQVEESKAMLRALVEEALDVDFVE